MQLQQSPFLSLVSVEQIQQTLRMMKEPPTAKLTPEIARELCQRTSSTMVLDGSIAQIGTQYSLILKAANCSNGETLTSTEAQASDKNHVLAALGKAATEMRGKLGELLNTVKKFDRPLANATTPSLDALRAYSLGTNAVHSGDETTAQPFFQQAIRLDPNFAMAYALLGLDYVDMGETNLAEENIQKAHNLRSQVGDHEKLFIEWLYYADHWGVGKTTPGP